ncbi:MAG: molybdopterin molybdotransferase MoeA [Deltaproteobacteria bacterium]|nr:molybdopterin molybdotransferase MoeA [Deltaproteobacteria bacterium]
MISVEQALNIILSEINVLGEERFAIPLSLGRVLAEDVRANRSNPPWDNSAMDGYAVIAKDTKGASKDNPAVLNVIEDLPAGYAAKNPLKNGGAIRIMTGAPMPDGADAVVMVEYTEKTGGKGSRAGTHRGTHPKDGSDGWGVRIFKEAKIGDNIRKQGEDFQTGDCLIKKGAVIRPIEIGIMAAIGKSFVSVYQRPRVAVLSTGDELVDIDEPLLKGKIVNTNGYILSALVKECGAEAIQIGIARDTKKDLKEKLGVAAKADCIISSGGVSVGDFDLVKDVLKEMGTEMRFWKVAMKPGKPLAFGIINSKPSFGLPGNPISSLVAFKQFVRPAILKMMGRREILGKTIPAILTKDIKKKPDRTHFVRGLLKQGAKGKAGTHRGWVGEYYAEPFEGQGSAVLSSFASSNCLIILPQEQTQFKKGDTIKAQLIDDSFLYQKF